MKHLLKLALLLLLALPTWAQSVSVSGTVTDGDGQVWANGTISFTFSGGNPPYTWTGGAFNPQTPITATLSATGTYSGSVPDSTQINPQGSQWKITVCPAVLPATTGCYITYQSITQANTTLNLTPPVIRFNVPTTPSAIAPISAYADVEITGGWVGFRYYSLTLSQMRACQVITANTCSTWANPATSGTSSFTNSIVAPNINYKTPFDYGAKGDLTQLLTCSGAAGQAILTCTGATFTTGTAATAGNPIVVNLAGATSNPNTNNPCTVAVPCALVTTILNTLSATQITLNTNIVTSVTNTLVYYGTDDNAAISNCIKFGTVSGGRCTLNPKIGGLGFMDSNANSLINFFGLSQALGQPPVPGGVLDGTGMVVSAPQGAQSGTNGRFLWIQSNSAGPFQIAGNAKYTIAASPTGIVAGGAGNQTVTVTTTASYGADIAVGRCVAITGNAVAGYNGVFPITATPSGTTFQYVLPQGVGTSLAGSGAGSVSDSICKGDTSFTMQNSSDAATLSPGQWIVLREKDSGAGDVIFSDWAQVKTVVGTLVTTTNPFRLQFPNARAWATAGGTCSAANPCGLGVIPILTATGGGLNSGLMQNYTIRDFHLVVPKIEDASGNAASGISVTLARGITITNHFCESAAQNCVFNYLTQGALIDGNNFLTSVPNEQASDVDFTTVSNKINMVGTPLFSPLNTPTGAGWDLDFGSAFGIFSNNTFGPCLNSCMAAFAGPYYSAISNNTFGWLYGNPGGTAIQISGGQYDTVSNNIGPGGSSTTTGIIVGDSSNFTVVEHSNNNQVVNNTMVGYPGGAYTGSVGNCGGLWGTDTCSDTTTQAGNGLQVGGFIDSSAQLSLLFSSATRNPMAMKDIGPSSNRHKYFFGPGAFGFNVFSLVDATSGKQAWNCYENFSNFCNFPNGWGATEGTAPTQIGAGFDQCYGDSVAHALKCSYNNGAFSNIPLVGIANTWTAAQTLGAGGSLNATSLLVSPTAPTIAAAGCGGAAASIPNNNGTAAFEVNVGTTPGSACTVTLPTAAHNWACFATDITTNSTSVFLQKQTGGTTTTAIITNFSDVAAATAFTASDVLRVSCHAY